MDVKKIYMLIPYQKKKEIEQIEIDCFFGGFNEAYVIVLNYPMVLDSSNYKEVVLGYEFIYYPRYRIKRPIEVYFDNDFYSLQEAIDNKIINEDNLKVIKENFDKYWSNYEKEFFKITDELKEDGLTEEIYLELREVIPNYQVLKYLGEYNGAYVAYYSNFKQQAGGHYLVETLDYFVYEADAQRCIRVIYDGKHYTQEEAYEKGIITYDNMVKIFGNYYGYSPIGITFNDDILTRQAKRNIIKQYFDEVLSIEYPDITWELWTLDDLMIYDDVKNIYGDSIYLQIWTALPEQNNQYYEEISGVTFKFCEDTRYIIYNDNKLYTLSAAYNQGIIDKETLESIYNDWFKE